MVRRLRLRTPDVRVSPEAPRRASHCITAFQAFRTDRRVVSHQPTQPTNASYLSVAPPITRSAALPSNTAPTNAPLRFMPGEPFREKKVPDQREHIDEIVHAKYESGEGDESDQYRTSRGVVDA